MADGLYTPLQLIAASGLLANAGISISSNLSNAVTSYNSITAIDTFLDTVTQASTFGLSASVITSLTTLAANTCPALSASVPTAYANTITTIQAAATIPTSPTGGFATFVESTGEKYIGSGDLRKFATVYFAVSGFQQQNSQFVYSTVNANKELGTTFTSMNDLVTGELTKVTLAIPAFADDLVKVGNTINFANLDNLGTPSSLLQQISVAADIVKGTIPSINQVLVDQGLTEDQIVALCTPDQSTLTLSRVEFNALQKKAYDALGNLLPADLVDVLEILDANLPNINSLQDLLDPKKLFPTSWPSLMIPTDAGPELIYNADGTANITLASIVSFGTNDTATGCDELSKIVPAQTAIPSVALAVSLSQLKNINNTNPEQLAMVLSTPVETLKGLDQIEDLTQAVPASVNTYIETNVATGSGPFGSLTIYDFFGTAAGFRVADWLNQVTAGLGTIDLSTLEAVYNNMLATVQGTYGPVGGPINIPSGPGAGAYANADSAFTTGLIPAANTIISNLVSTYPAQCNSMDVSFDSICEQIYSEAINQGLAGVNYDDLTNLGQGVIFAFASGLGQVGAYRTPGGQAEYLTNIADVSTQSGQAIVGAIRESTNRIALNETGITVQSFSVSSDYPGDPAGPGTSLEVISIGVDDLEPVVVPPPVEYQTDTNPTSTSYTVDEATAAAESQLTNPAVPQPSVSTSPTAPAVVKIIAVYEAGSSLLYPGAETSTIVAGSAFWINLEVHPSDADTVVTATTSAGSFITYPGIMLNSGSGMDIQIPGWMIPAAGVVTLTVSANQPAGPATADTVLINVVTSNYPNSTTVTQDGWFESVNLTTSGTPVTVTIRGTPSTAFTWGTNWTSTWPVGAGTFDADGYAVYSGLSSPPTSNNNQILVSYSSGENTTTTFITRLA